MNIAGYDFAADLEYFSAPETFFEIPDMKELEKLAAFPLLKGANFGDSNLNDAGLRALATCQGLTNLNLQGTAISDAGLLHLAALPHLQYLRLKDNRQLTDTCMPGLLAFPSLLEIQLQETSVTITGIKAIVSHPTLSHLILSLHQGNYDLQGLLAVSSLMPKCTILLKGYGEFLAGNYDGCSF